MIFQLETELLQQLRFGQILEKSPEAAQLLHGNGTLCDILTNRRHILPNPMSDTKFMHTSAHQDSVASRIQDVDDLLNFGAPKPLSRWARAENRPR